MQNTQTTAIILAAGMGKRMKSELPKVLHPLLGRPLLGYALAALQQAQIQNPIAVIGHRGELVSEFVGPRARTAWQKPQLGTGHAVQVAMPQLEDFQGNVIITCGDAPLISAETFAALPAYLDEHRLDAVVVTMALEDPRSYGRVIRDSRGQISRIVEFKDASEAERKVNEVNTGTYCFRAPALRESLGELRNDNAQGEYYLTDTISILLAKGRAVGALLRPNPDEFLGVNDPRDLALAEEKLLRQIRERHMANGVIIEQPETVRIEPEVTIGARTRIRAGVSLEGGTSVGEDCVIGPHVTCANAAIPANYRFTAAALQGPSPNTGV